MTDDKLNEYAKSVRKRIFEFKTRTSVGHLASCLSCVDILVSLYNDPAVDFDHSKDMLIFSKAHGSPAVYPILADLGYFPQEELDRYATPSGILKLHSDWKIPGCYHVGGSLGNNIGYAAGLAFDHAKRIFVILGDAEMYEGAVWETLLFVSHHNLSNMTFIIDRNKLGILGATEELLKLEPIDRKLESFGFDAHRIDGHSFSELRRAFAISSSRPKVIIAETVKGKGVSYMEGKWEWHTMIPKKPEEIAKGFEELS